MITAIARRIAALLVLGAAILGIHIIASTIGAFSPVQVARSGHDPLLVATSVMATLAMGACVWLTCVTAVETLALALRLQPLRSVAERLAPAAWRTLVLRPVAVATLVLPPMAMPIAAAVPAAAAETVGAHSHQLEMVAFGSENTVLTMSVFDGEVPATGEPVDQERISIHVVAPGENLWSIASAHLSTTLGRGPSATEVKSYWSALIDLNRTHLPDPANPDLIYRGIELQMPPVPAI